MSDDATGGDGAADEASEGDATGARGVDGPADASNGDGPGEPADERVPASAPAEARSTDRAHLLSLAPWALLSAGWGVLTVYKLTNLVTPGALAGLLVSLGLVLAGVASVVKYGDESAGKFLAGCLFLVGGVSTALSAGAGTAVWFPNDLVTTVADVTILGALVLVLSLKTERGQDAVA
jgi:hypothetical protein